jgi:hypothetical protein
VLILFYSRIIYYIGGVDEYKLILIFEGRQLEDDKTTKDYNIIKDKIVIMKKSFQIFVNTLTGRIIIIEVLEDESIKSLKQKIEDKEGLIKVRSEERRVGKEC